MGEIVNAKITNVSITMEDHGLLTFYITLEGASWGCNFGGYSIASGCLNWKDEDFKAESGAGLVAMMRIMKTVGVERWEDLKNKYVRVETKGWGNTIHKIGNILEDKWFDISDFFKKCKEGNTNE